MYKDGRVTDVSCEQFLKQPAPIEVTDGGIERAVKPVHLSKHSFPKDKTELGRDTDVR